VRGPDEALREPQVTLEERFLKLMELLRFATELKWTGQHTRR